ncbi:alpha/beta fold hydrolase [Streptomyces silvensis]|uniref:Alpha/beta hydrolase n=1 Tax=Streptomyces silvensis TaxID=1765722 RepID=A0A0W7WSU2_9ACTN|nr:alpha/beta hydrolase [Streptomyces silvensis]KUF13638.1 alpha/beta hydrolase [Streptomyces silvensis]
MTDTPDVFFLDTPDGPLAYRDSGWGAPLVLLHGGFVDHRMWDEQIAHFSRNFRVIAPDVRGHGWSSNASVPFRQTDDLAALLRHLDVGPAVLVGLSMGAGIAVDTALEHPALVRALVVSGAGTSEPEFDDPWVKAIQAEWARAAAAGDAAGFAAAHLLFVAGPHRTFDDVDQDVIVRVRDMVTHTLSKHTGDEPPSILPVTDTWARAAELDVPVLALSGAVDSDDCKGMAARLADSVADGRTVTVENCAHYPNMERPDAFNDALQGFLDQMAADAVAMHGR